MPKEAHACARTMRTMLGLSDVVCIGHADSIMPPEGRDRSSPTMPDGQLETPPEVGRRPDTPSPESRSCVDATSRRCGDQRKKRFGRKWRRFGSVTGITTYHSRHHCAWPNPSHARAITVRATLHPRATAGESAPPALSRRFPPRSAMWQSSAAGFAGMSAGVQAAGLACERIWKLAAWLGVPMASVIAPAARITAPMMSSGSTW